MSGTLIICIGNTARGDDGVAHEVARLLHDKPPRPDVRIIEAMGLDVAMAQDAAAANLLVIVDACRRETPAVEVADIQPVSAIGPTGHGIDPAGLLMLAESLYGRRPRAVLVAVAAPVIAHSDELSSAAIRAAEQAARTVLGLLPAEPD